MSAMKKRSGRSTTIARALKKTTSKKKLGTWGNVGLSGLNFKEIMSKSEVIYKTQTFVFHIEPNYLSKHPRTLPEFHNV